MITRVFKHILSDHLKKTKPQYILTTLINALNSFFCLHHISYSKAGVAVGNTPTEVTNSDSPYFSLTPGQLWQEIRRRVHAKYAFSLPGYLPIALFSIPTLRTICRRNGIQLQTRAYNLSSETPFTLDDIITVFPVVKRAEPLSKDGNDLLETAKIHLAQGKFDIGYDLLSAALGIFQQVYGPLHRDTAEVCSLLSKVLRDTDKEGAIQHQERALIICERVLGLDHYLTAQAYSNLSSLLQIGGPSKAVLGPAYRALYLYLTLGEINNLCVVEIVSQIGKTLQELNELSHSKDYVLKAIQLTENVYGSVNLTTAHLCHLMATLSEDINESLKYETRNHEICKKLLGEKDLRTMEANIWLSKLFKNTSQLLNSRKKQQQIKAKREAKQGTDITHVINPDLAALPVADVLKYIESPIRNPRLAIPSKVQNLRNSKPVLVSEDIESSEKIVATQEDLEPISQPIETPIPSSLSQEPLSPREANSEIEKPAETPKPQQQQQNQNPKGKQNQNHKHKQNRRKPQKK